MKNSFPKSPITNGEVKLISTIQISDLVKCYLEQSSINIEYLLKGVDEISLFECKETGYRFFYPFCIAGDGQFYEKLEQIPWYYANWKWDYDVANDFINNNSSVLDIGCGEGKFLDYLSSKKNCFCQGLELNELACEIAIKNGMNVMKLTIQELAKSSNVKFDYVTFFQVLEHISDVDSFLKSAIEMVKPGGTIILAVPNNEPYYLTYDKNHYLNLPPHHMGWWNENSLTLLCRFYKIKLEAIVKQPLEHYTSYANNFLSIKLKLPEPFVSLFRPLVKVIVYLLRKKINGASILAVYRKL